MTAPSFNDMRGTLADAHTLRMQRRLPGPIERVWSYLSDGDLRRQWLASGTMSLQPGASFELVWRNDELSSSAAERPDGFTAESRATCQFVEVEPPLELLVAHLEGKKPPSLWSTWKRLRKDYEEQLCAN